MELKNLARKKKRTRNKEREVFGLERKVFRLHTVPKPFNFAVLVVQINKYVANKSREREMKECTFVLEKTMMILIGETTMMECSRDRVSDGFRVLYDYDMMMITVR